MIYLVKVDGTVQAFYSEAEMKSAGFGIANKIVTEEEFNSNGCYARIIGDEIIIGKTEQEKQLEELSERISEIDAQLLSLDSKYLTKRVLAGATQNDLYALEQIQAHDTEAIPLREERKTLDNARKSLIA